jgi:hypothetical protein
MSVRWESGIKMTKIAPPRRAETISRLAINPYSELRAFRRIISVVGMLARPIAIPTKKTLNGLTWNVAAAKKMKIGLNFRNNSKCLSSLKNFISQHVAAKVSHKVLEYIPIS